MSPRAAATVFAAFAVAALSVGAALALFGDATPVPSNAFSTDVLQAPTGVTASTGPSITVNWIATSDTYASGHRVLRSTTAGGPYSQIAQVTPRTTTTYPDSSGGGTFYYIVRAYYQNWESANSNEVQATCCSTGFRSPSANAADTGGDGNGFEGNATGAYASGGNAADDANSGTTTNTSCSNGGKDRHRFYDYGFSIPAGSAIGGIEVRLDARVGTASGTRFMCVELSWNGGTSWTAAKTTGSLTGSIVTYTLGTSSDAWGRTWLPADFSNANFRVRVTDVADSTSRQFFLDWVPVRVTYSPP